MLLFVDNDIIIKLGSAGLIQEIEKIFNTNASSIFILPTAKSYFSKSKKLKHKYSHEIIDKTLSIINNYSVIPDEYIDQERFITLSSIENVDSGEKVLFSITPLLKDFLILTGDKNAIIQLNNHPILEPIKNDLARKIVCLESILIKLLERYNFNSISEKITQSDFFGDTVIRLIFSQSNLTLENVKNGLNSYYSDLRERTGVLLW